MFRPMTFKDGRPQRLQPVGHCRAAQVGTGYGIPEGEKDFCDPAHADSADTDEVDALHGCEQRWFS